jgi:DNA-binding transcriptional LysR family regulator
MTVAEPPTAPGTAARGGLRVGFVPGVTLTKWRRIWSERCPRITLRVIDVAEQDQRSALDEDRVDMCFVRLPLAVDSLHVIPLYEEVPVVVAPKDHPIAVFEEVALADLAEENVLDSHDTEHAIDLVAGGAGVLLVPHSIARSHSRRDLIYRPVADAPPTQIALAWRQDHGGDLIEEFIGIVRGRTVNSSRTARPAPAEPAAKARPAPKPSTRAVRPGRRRRSR